jgi:hypothetical protein
VGCLRCTTEFPDFVQVTPNPERQKLGDSYFTFNYVDAISYEAEGGMIPVKGAGYRGKFGGEGWDGMWTDMSEIVRPTRDGIHGREFISTVVDIGYRPNFLVFDEQGQSAGAEPKVVSIPVPVMFDLPPMSDNFNRVSQITAQAAEKIESLAILPISVILEKKLEGQHIVPLVNPGEQRLLSQLSFKPRLVEMDGWDENLFIHLSNLYPESLISLRIPFCDPKELTGYAERGVQVFHLLADYHGRGRNGMFVLEMIREAHRAFVEAGIRQEVTLIGSGGMIAAEHIPKAILCGLDAVALDTPVMVAIQGKFKDDCAAREASCFTTPSKLTLAWGTQRLVNLVASWRDQLLEIMGAMGLREVRRLRGEMGRAMFMVELEADAFAGVSGYERA